MSKKSNTNLNVGKISARKKMKATITAKTKELNLLLGVPEYTVLIGYFEGRKFLTAKELSDNQDNYMIPMLKYYQKNESAWDNELNHLAGFLFYGNPAYMHPSEIIAFIYEGF